MNEKSLRARQGGKIQGSDSRWPEEMKWKKTWRRKPFLTSRGMGRRMVRTMDSSKKRRKLTEKKGFRTHIPSKRGLQGKQYPARQKAYGFEGRGVGENRVGNGRRRVGTNPIKDAIQSEILILVARR